MKIFEAAILLTAKTITRHHLEPRGYFRITTHDFCS